MAYSIPDPNSMSMIEYYQYTNNPIIKKFVFSLIEAGIVYQDWPMITDEKLRMGGSRFIGDLPTPTYAPVGGLPAIVKTSPQAFSEQLWYFANGIQIPDYMRRDKSQITNPFDIQVKAFMMGMAFTINDNLFNNNPVTGDPNAPAGLTYRLTNTQGPGGTSIYGNNSECNINAALTLNPSSFSTAQANALLEAFEYALDTIGDADGNGVVFYMNQKLMRLANKCVRALGAGGGFDMTRDAFDRRVLTFRSAKIRDAGRKAPTNAGLQNQFVISNTQNADGTDTGIGNHTSFFAVKLGTEDCAGTQFEPFNPTPPYLLPGKTVWELDMQYAHGIWQPNTRAVTRSYNIQVTN